MTLKYFQVIVSAQHVIRITYKICQLASQQPQVVSKVVGESSYTCTSRRTGLTAPAPRTPGCSRVNCTSSLFMAESKPINYQVTISVLKRNAADDWVTGTGGAPVGMSTGRYTLCWQIELQ